MLSQWSLDDIVRRHPALNHLSETLGRENFIQCNRGRDLGVGGSSRVGELRRPGRPLAVRSSPSDPRPEHLLREIISKKRAAPSFYNAAKSGAEFFSAHIFLPA